MTIEHLYQHYLQHPVIVTDSRKVTPGCIFFALKGEKFDGNVFAEKALADGASFAVVDDPATGGDDRRFIHVKDVLKTLQHLALHHRKQLNIPIIGITGTNGKTTTKELTLAVLSKKYKTTATSGNLNNHIGVPLTILSIKKDTEMALVEMGANHIGEIWALSGLALPTHGIITNIGKAHLDGFGGFPGVIKAKTELYRCLEISGGTAFVNGDDDLLMEQATKLRKVVYGTSPNVAFRGENNKAEPFLVMDVLMPERLTLQTHLFGAYNAANILAACAIGKTFGVPDDMIKQALEEYEPVNNRSQVYQTKRNRLFLDAYNANPSSMELAIRNFAALPGEKKIYILGDMLELGTESEREHEQILRVLGEVGANDVYLVGPVFLDVNTQIKWMGFGDSELARMWFEHNRTEGADILIKGSRGIRMEIIAEVL